MVGAFAEPISVMFSWIRGGARTPFGNSRNMPAAAGGSLLQCAAKAQRRGISHALRLVFDTAALLSRRTRMN
jgi:hypothetical protein